MFCSSFDKRNSTCEWNHAKGYKDDDFTAVPFSGQTISWAFLNPSVSPYKRSVQVGQESFSTNPAVRLYRYDTNTGEVSEVVATIRHGFVTFRGCLLRPCGRRLERKSNKNRTNKHCGRLLIRQRNAHSAIERTYIFGKLRNPSLIES